MLGVYPQGQSATNPRINPSINEVVEIHERTTRRLHEDIASNSGLPLGFDGLGYCQTTFSHYGVG